MDNKEILAQIPSPPEGSSFSVQKIYDHTDPHPFMITPRHMEHASKYHFGSLGRATTNAIPCGWKGCNLKGDEHKSQKVLMIEVDDNSDLNAVPGLHAYLLSIKEKATELGIEGFVFPKRKK